MGVPKRFFWIRLDFKQVFDTLISSGCLKHTFRRVPLMMSLDDTRQHVLEAAGPIFAEKGFKAASVRAICDLAGANIGAVNYYFRSKEQLYIETVRLAYESCAGAAPMPTWPAGTPAGDRLRAFIRVFLTRLLNRDRPAWHTLLILREVSNPTPGACSEFVSNFVRPTFDVLQSILHDLLPAEVPQEKRHLVGASIVGQCLHYLHARHVLPLLVGEEARSYDVERLTDHITEFSLAALRGLYPRAAAKKAHGART
jgi:AcrR family transcriptional regulator